MEFNSATNYPVLAQTLLVKSSVPQDFQHLRCLLQVGIPRNPYIFQAYCKFGCFQNLTSDLTICLINTQNLERHYNNYSFTLKDANKQTNNVVHKVTSRRVLSTQKLQSPGQLECVRLPAGKCVHQPARLPKSFYLEFLFFFFSWFHDKFHSFKQV